MHIERNEGTTASIRLLLAGSDVNTEAPVLGLSTSAYTYRLADPGQGITRLLAPHNCRVVIWDKTKRESLAFLTEMKTEYPLLPVIVVASEPSLEEAVRATKAGAFQYVAHPCAPHFLQRHIQDALTSVEGATAQRPDAGTKWRADIVHDSAAMKELLDAAALVAMSTAPLLLLGESGSGKERIARAVHACSARRDKPFIAVNATALPEQLLESELFGHVRGAFSGAVQTRVGLFMEAHGGTLLLDEIGDLPQVIQPKLLRAVQFGEVRAVGSDRVRKVDVRIIAATHRDLQAMSHAGQFREDLRYRLNTLSLVVPPLREHAADIPALSHKFLAAARARAPTSPVRAIAAEAMAVLERAPWPGNVRELESAIERVVVMGRQPLVSPGDLAFLNQGSGPYSPEPFGALPADTDIGVLSAVEHRDALSLREMSDRYMDWVLARVAGDKMSAAKILGVDVSTLYRRQRAKSLR